MSSSGIDWTNEMVSNFDYLLKIIKDYYPEAFSESYEQIKIPVHLEGGGPLASRGVVELSLRLRESLIKIILHYPIKITEENRARVSEKMAEFKARAINLYFDPQIGPHSRIRLNASAHLDSYPRLSASFGTEWAIKAEYVLRSIRLCVLTYQLSFEPLYKAARGI